VVNAPFKQNLKKKHPKQIKKIKKKSNQHTKNGAAQRNINNWMSGVETNAVNFPRNAKGNRQGIRGEKLHPRPPCCPTDNLVTTGMK
jgi:hypothetical protein